MITLNLWPEYFSKELLKLNVLNKIWFQEYKNNQENRSVTQGSRDSELKWQEYNFYSTTDIS